MPSRPAVPARTPKPRRPYAPRIPPEQRREQLLDAALSVIVERGYSGVSIEAIAREAGVTRPVVHDHFPDLGRLLRSLVEREERASLEQLEHVVPGDPGESDPVEALAGGVKRFLEAVGKRPATWRIILLPLDGTPMIVREHLQRNRAMILGRIGQLVRESVRRGELPRDLDVELAARAVRDLSEEAGRMVLTDSEHYSPARYESFARSALNRLMARSSPFH
ncbi:MAG: TetR/AcrR family transcriptional regulator [Actinomycetota bacterium]|nr:TetR/AcrR family transcriptional regulator [Actinomycetota bacterium]